MKLNTPSTGASLAHGPKEIAADVVQMFTSKLHSLWLIISVEQSVTVTQGCLDLKSLHTERGTRPETFA